MSVTTQAKHSKKAIPLPRVGLGSWRLTLVLAAICALPVVFYAPFFNEPFMRDEGFYATVAQIIKHGGIPYRDAFDNKPPMIFAWYYASFAIFGEHVWAPRVLVSLLLSATTLLVYFQARFIYSQGGAAFAAAAFAVSIGFAMFETNANVEYFMLLPTVAGLLCFTLGVRRDSVPWYFAAGALSGVSIMTKETSLFAFLVYFPYLGYQAYRDQGREFLRQRRLWLKASSLGAGCLAVCALILAPFALTGTGGDFFDAVVVYTWTYVGGGMDPLTKLRVMFTAPIMLAYATGPWFIVGVCGAWALCRQKTDPEKVFLVAWVAACGLGIYAAGRFYLHYYVIIFPGIALLVPAGASYLRDHWQSRRVRLPIWSVLTLLALPGLFINGGIYAHSSVAARHEHKYSGGIRSQWEIESPALADWIVAHTSANDQIYNFGFQSELYFYANKTSPTRFYIDHAFGLDEKYEQDAIRELSANPPVYVIDSAIYEDRTKINYYSEPVHEWIEQNYDYVGKIYYADVWRLKGYQQ